MTQIKQAVQLVVGLALIGLMLSPLVYIAVEAFRFPGYVP